MRRLLALLPVIAIAFAAMAGPTTIETPRKQNRLESTERVLEGSLIYSVNEKAWIPVIRLKFAELSNVFGKRFNLEISALTALNSGANLGFCVGPILRVADNADVLLGIGGKWANHERPSLLLAIGGTLKIKGF